MLLELTDVRGGYGGGDVVRGVTCRADSGDVLCLVGPNGCGKTTLFRLLLGSLPLRGGSVRVGGRDPGILSPRERAGLIAYIPQHHAPVFAYTALDVVVMGRAARLSAFASPGAAGREAALSALEKVRALPLAHRPYTALSGGQRQLVLAARAICQSAQVILMDEPAANLDYANQQLLLEAVAELTQGGCCVVMSTHSPEHPGSIGAKVLLMKEGRGVGFGPPEEMLTPENLEAVYGVEMDVATLRDRYGVRRTVCLPVRRPGPGGAK